MYLWLGMGLLVPSSLDSQLTLLTLGIEGQVNSQPAYDYASR